MLEPVFLVVGLVDLNLHRVPCRFEVGAGLFEVRRYASFATPRCEAG